ncbi:MAG: 1-deoxy-D-xylulose-5-phosphate synthase, partial [Treponema sp.]|nr:1-deoxy-D-xylulose-5-phosphate synthase [Treponema sp.]
VLEDTFRRVQRIPRPVVIHVVTKKGRGYSPAENDPATFHGVGPFNISDGVVEKYDTLSFTEAFSHKIVEMAKKDERIAAVTAAMSKGTGLDSFSRHFKNRFFDVGIAEEHAVTFAGGLAAGGMVPVAAIYSTFMQRSVDQIIEDVAMQQRHVVLALDRAGAVPADGETHQGIFDIALFRTVPNLVIMTVSSAADLGLCLDWAVYGTKMPVSIRWPKMSCPSEIPSFSKPVEEGRGLFIDSDEFAPALSARLRDEMEGAGLDSSLSKGALSNRDKVLFVCTGSMYAETLTAARSLLLKGTECAIFILRFIKPFDEQYFLDSAKPFNSIVFVEDGMMAGSFSCYLEGLVHRTRESSVCRTKVLAFPDSFFGCGTRDQLLDEAGLSSAKIAEAAFSLVQNA